jgi:hypothetical protein
MFKPFKESSLSQENFDVATKFVNEISTRLNKPIVLKDFFTDANTATIHIEIDVSGKLVTINIPTNPTEKTINTLLPFIKTMI